MLTVAAVGAAVASGPDREPPAVLASPAAPVSAVSAVSSRAPTDPLHPGAAAHRGGRRPPLPAAPVTPVPGREDWVDLGVGAGDPCWTPPDVGPLVVCARPTAGPPRRRVVVVGDSHSQQYAGALEETARVRGWQVLSILRGACPFSTASETVPGSPGCVAWNAAAIAEIVRMRPDAVLTTATRDARPGLTESTPPGFVAAWRALGRAGIPVLAVRDNPRFATAPAACVAAHGQDAPACGVPRAAVLAPAAPYRLLPDVPPTVSFLDVGDYLCGPVTCPPVVGNVLVYADDNHLSATFTRTLAPVLADRLVPIVER
ncbi:hypothetical protein GCM10023200_45460 [Actinomycetospora chlora]|uniref:SGNH domain-containing protein n=1 Tax=Actinomycetospora chlora TaxID=663608 RepID=A0ABP9C0C6_9PSEU